MDLSDYLSQPCDNKECDRTASHNQARDDGRKWCNTHTDFERPARARNA